MTEQTTDSEKARLQEALRLASESEQLLQEGSELLLALNLKLEERVARARVERKLQDLKITTEQ